MMEPFQPKRTSSKVHTAKDLSGYEGFVRAYPEGFSRWDFLEVRAGSLTIRGLVEHLKQAHGLDLLDLSTGASMVMWNPAFKSHREERMDMQVVDVFRLVAAGKPGEKRAAADLGPGRTFLLLDGNIRDSAGDVLVPTIKFFFA